VGELSFKAIKIVKERQRQVFEVSIISLPIKVKSFILLLFALANTRTKQKMPLKTENWKLKNWKTEKLKKWKNVLFSQKKTVLFSHPKNENKKRREKTEKIATLFWLTRRSVLRKENTSIKFMKFVISLAWVNGCQNIRNAN
jgi:hypothetical protein